MFITFDPAKRQKTLEERGLDMAWAARVFAGKTFTIEDDRQDYGEIRWITYGKHDGRTVVIVWTAREEARRIISLRKANDKEDRRFGPYL
jgi:uncharacterized protein